MGNCSAVCPEVASSLSVGSARRAVYFSGEVKKYVCAELDKLGLSYIPSAANFMMIDMRREVRPLLEAMRRAGIEVGRFFPSLPNHMRVTVGTRGDMQAFLAALRQVVA